VIVSETHWKQNFDYKYTGTYELKQGETKTLVISRTATEEVMSTTGQKQLCFVAYFSRQEKPMILNKTNCKTITKMYGAYVENWIGKAIIIESKLVKSFGEMVDALRVKNSIPVTSKPADFEPAKKKLLACIGLDQLKAVYLSLSKEEQAATVTTKEEMKEKLSERAE
jgi:hypothetical protein